MKLSAFLSITNPHKRGDLYRQCIASALGLVDELIIVDGGGCLGLNLDNLNEDGSEKETGQTFLHILGSDDGSIDWITSWNDARIKIVHLGWPQEFNWLHIGRVFQTGYEHATGDWVLHLDCDFIIHERDYAALIRACAENNDQPAFSLLKRQFILPDRFNLKSRLVVAVNKGRYKEQLRFDSGGDCCQPSLNGKYIEPGTVPDVKIPLYNYEKLIKTEGQITDDVGRMARAWQSHFGQYRLGGPDDESAYQEWLTMQQGRFQKPQEHLQLSDHPQIMRATIESLQPDQWGYSGFNRLEINDYARR